VDTFVEAGWSSVSPPVASGEPVPVPPAALALRPAGPDDADGVAAFLAGLSVRTAYWRFHTGIGATPTRLARRLVAAGPGRHAWVAEADGAIVALGNAVADRSGCTEVGAVVADALQGRGIGTRLVEAALFAAAREGATTVRFVVLSENRRLIAALRRAFPESEMSYDGTECELLAPLRRPAR
jgi:GNAT superfamily N-acetyltransferase